ncbi:MAG: hypothetical protein V1729_01820 [Candidatus Woesearchaeota archaeon]
MSIKVVVIAVLCLVILIVLLMIMTGKTKIFSKAAASCEQKGIGAGCIAKNAPCDGPIYKLGTDCDEYEPWCCVPVG